MINCNRFVAPKKKQQIGVSDNKDTRNTYNWSISFNSPFIYSKGNAIPKGMCQNFSKTPVAHGKSHLVQMLQQYGTRYVRFINEKGLNPFY